MLSLQEKERKKPNSQNSHQPWRGEATTREVIKGLTKWNDEVDANCLSLLPSIYKSNYTSQTLTEKARLGELIKSLNYNHPGKLVNASYILLCDTQKFIEAFLLWDTCIFSHTSLAHYQLPYFNTNFSNLRWHLEFYIQVWAPWNKKHGYTQASPVEATSIIMRLEHLVCRQGWEMWVSSAWRRPADLNALEKMEPDSS